MDVFRQPIEKMPSHLRYAGLPFEAQRGAFLEIVRSDPLVEAALAKAEEAALPDWLLVSGVLYNTVWNHLTGKPSGYGIKDIDLFYFDGADLSYQAEDREIVRTQPHFAGLPRPVEIRNQARVHLWYPERYGQACPAYRNAQDSLRNFASKTHAVGVRSVAAGHLELIAPFGLDDLFSFRMTPNHALDNRRTHTEKAERAKSLWPEVSVVAW